MSDPADYPAPPPGYTGPVPPEGYPDADMIRAGSVSSWGVHTGYPTQLYDPDSEEAENGDEPIEFNPQEALRLDYDRRALALNIAYQIITIGGVHRATTNDVLQGARLVLAFLEGDHPTDEPPSENIRYAPNGEIRYARP